MSCPGERNVIKKKKAFGTIDKTRLLTVDEIKLCVKFLELDSNCSTI